jgi:hypothetical protein
MNEREIYVRFIHVSKLLHLGAAMSMFLVVLVFVVLIFISSPIITNMVMVVGMMMTVMPRMMLTMMFMMMAMMMMMMIFMFVQRRPGTNMPFVITRKGNILRSFFTERVDGALAVSQFEDTMSSQLRLVMVSGSLHRYAYPFKPEQHRKHTEQEISVLEAAWVIK